MVPDPPNFQSERKGWFKVWFPAPVNAPLKYLVLSREPIVLLNFPGVSAGKLGFKSILLVHLQCYAALANNENVK